MNWKNEGAPERKYHQPEAGLVVTEGSLVSGYASLFGKEDLGHDIVQPGAFRASLAERGAAGVKMLFQHDPTQPICQSAPNSDPRSACNVDPFFFGFFRC